MTDTKYNLIRGGDFLASRTPTFTGTALECVNELLEAFPNIVIDEDADYPGCFDAFVYTDRHSWTYAIQPVGFKL